MHKIKIGLVGFGKHSIKVWLPILALNKHFILTAISSEKVDHASINAEVKKLLPETHPPVSLFSEHDSLLKDSSIECVLIATSNIKHGPQVILALNNGKHVLCEKPLCFTEKHTNSIKKILESKKLTLETGFMYRYHPQWIFIKNYFKNFLIDIINISYS